LQVILISTYMKNLQLPTVGNHNFFSCLARLAANGLHTLDYIHALGDLAEHNVLAIQPFCFSCAQEELGSVGVGTGICHGQDSGASVLQLEVLILELVSVDALATGAVVVREVSALAHEAGDHAVEARPLEAESLLSGTQRTEVLSCLGNHIVTEIHDDTAGGFTPDGDVKEALHWHLGVITDEL